MKLTGKALEKPVEPVKAKNLSEVQKALWMVRNGSEIPWGKYKGKSVKWVQENDKSYWKWAWDNEVLWKMEVMVLKTDAMQPDSAKKKYMYHVTPEGKIWVALREIEEKTHPSIWI